MCASHSCWCVWSLEGLVNAVIMAVNPQAWLHLKSPITFDSWSLFITSSTSILKTFREGCDMNAQFGDEHSEIFWSLHIGQSGMGFVAIVIDIWLFRGHVTVQFFFHNLFSLHRCWSFLAYFLHFNLYLPKGNRFNSWLSCLWWHRRVSTTLGGHSWVLCSFELCF